MSLSPQERAEKILEHARLSGSVVNRGLKERIAAQIEEACAEVERNLNHQSRSVHACKKAIEIAKQDAWNVAKEKAKGIAEEVCPAGNYGENCHESIASRIDKMEPHFATPKPSPAVFRQDETGLHLEKEPD